MPVLPLDGRPYHYLDEGEGPPCLLLHAFPLSGEAFRPQVGGVPARLILPDHRGFGQSAGTGSGAVTMEDHARDALALLDALHVDRAFVGGVSMGGYVAMALLRIAPRRVAGLALLDTQAGPDDAAGRERREALARTALEEGLDALVPAMLPRLLAPDSPARARVEALVRASATREGVAAALRGMALRPDSSPELAAFDGPAVVVVGDEDRLTGIEKALALHCLLAGSILVRVQGAGHLAHIEKPAEVNAALTAWITTPQGASTPPIA